jgi:hypothetical protein
MSITDQRSAISRLFQSESKTSKLLGLAIVATIFLPSVFQALDDDNLTLWQRAEKVTVAAGQTLITVALAGVDPKGLEDAPVPEPDKMHG